MNTEQSETPAGTIYRQRWASRRALLLLGALLAIALGVSLLNQELVPRSWHEWLPSPRLGLPAEGERPPRAVTGQDGTGRGVFLFPGAPRLHVTGLAGDASTLALLLVAGTLLAFMLPGRIARTGDAVEAGGRGLLRLGLTGLAGYVVLAALALLAAVSVLGAVAVLLLLILLLALLLLSMVVVGVPLGRALAHRFGADSEHPLVYLLAGLLALFILGLIPVVGVLALTLTALVGFGAILLTRFGSERAWSFELDELRY